MTFTDFAIIVLTLAVLFLLREVRAINQVVERRGNQPPVVNVPPVPLDPRDVAAAAVDRHVQEHHRR